MIVVRFQKTFPLRVSEWAMSAVLVNLGVLILCNPEVFEQPQHAAMARMAGPYIWGWACLVMGVVRATALIINGAWRASPHIRALTAFLSCFIWLEITFGLASSQIVALSLAVYPWFLLLDTYNVFRASSDARAADDRAKAAKAARL